MKFFFPTKVNSSQWCVKISTLPSTKQSFRNSITIGFHSRSGKMPSLSKPQSFFISYFPFINPPFLEKEKANHSSILAWKIPQPRSLVGCSQLQRVGHNWVTNRQNPVFHAAACFPVPLPYHTHFQLHDFITFAARILVF